MRSVVLGVGNVLLADDGAGVHAARRLAAALDQRAGVQVVDGGTLSFTLAPLIVAAERLIVIDAAQLQAPAGTVRTFFDAAFDRFLGSAKLTVHEVSLIDLFDIARLTDGIPAQRALVAVQPAHIGWGETLTPAVEASVTPIVSRVLELLHEWPATPPECLT